MRGVGGSYDGPYYVKSVTHTVRIGQYKQSFTLTRDGVGALFPVLPPWATARCRQDFRCNALAAGLPWWHSFPATLRGVACR